MTQPQPWVRCPQPRNAARTRLICFPHAGGSANAYRSWPQLLGPATEVHVVQYPGRADRFAEPFVDEMTVAADQIARELASQSGRPYALFGHSMGGALAYEVARLLNEWGVAPPDHLFISGRQPPMHHRTGDVHTFDDARLAAELLRLSTANAELLSEPELAELMFPIIRNDYRLIERYSPGDPTALTMPITVLLGTEDEELTVTEARDWRHYTQRQVTVRQFPGDHFYLIDQRHAVAELIATALSADTIDASSTP